MVFSLKSWKMEEIEEFLGNPTRSTHSFFSNFFFFFPFLREFQTTPNDSFLLLDQDTNRFLVQARIELQISYSIIRDFTSFVNLNPRTYVQVISNVKISRLDIEMSIPQCNLNSSIFCLDYRLRLLIQGFSLGLGF